MKILYVEDEIAHVYLTERTLQENLDQEFQLLHSGTIVNALKILQAQPDIDLILSDLRLPDGTGLDLLKQVRQLKSPPAVVLVTAQGDQQIAVAALKAGAADYLVKQSDYLHRLPVVISNAVAQNRYLREQEALRQAEFKYQSLIEQIPAVVFLSQANAAQTTIYVSPRIEELTGYTAVEWRADPGLWTNSIHPEDQEEIIAKNQQSRRDGSRFVEEYRFIRRDGTIVWVKQDANLIRDKDGHSLYWQGLLIDITREKEAETALQRQLEEIALLHSATVAASNAPDVDKLVEQVTNVIGKTLSSDNFGVLLFSETSGTLKPHSSYQGAKPEKLTQPLSLNEGITGKVARTGAPIRLGDVSLEPAYIQVSEGVCAELCVPIISRGRLIGVINTESEEPNAYSERDERLLVTIAHTLATAMDKLSSFEEARQRAAELETLYRASRSLTLSLEPEVIGKNLLATIDQLLGCEFSSVYLLDEVNRLLVPVAVSQKATSSEEYGKDQSALLKMAIPLGSGLIGRVGQHGQPIRSGALTQERRYYAVLKNTRSELCLPLIARRKVIGVLSIESTQTDAYTERHENLLTALANSAAIAFENARLYKSELARREQAEALRTATASLSTAMDLQTLRKTILISVQKLIPCDSASIRLFDQGPDQTMPENAEPTGSPALAHKPNTNELWSPLRRPIILTASQARDEFPPAQGTNDFQSGMRIPLPVGEKLFGVISLTSRKPGLYNEEHRTLAQTFASQAGIAIEKAHLYEDALRGSERRAVLHRISQDIVRFSQDTEQIYVAIHEAASQMMTCDVFTIVLQDPSGNHAVQAYTMEAGKRVSVERTEGLRRLTEAVIRNDNSMILRNSGEIRMKLALAFEEFQRVESIVAVPLLAGSQTIGMISAHSYRPSAYNLEEQALLEMLAAHAATAIENKRLFDEQSRRALIIEALADIANEIATTREVVPALEQIAQRALDLLNANHVAIYLLQDDNVTLRTVTAQGQYRSELLGHARRVGEGITGSVFLNGRPEIVNNTQEDPRRVVVPGTPSKQEKLESLMSSPLILRGKPIGVINAWRLKENGLFNESELNFLVGIAHQVSICIESGRLFQETNRQAQEAAAIAEVGRDISSTLQLDMVLERIASYAMDLLQAETSAVYLADTHTSTLRAIAAFGMDAEAIKNDSLEVGTGILGRIALQNIGEIVNDTASDPRAIMVKGTEENPTEHIMGVPILLKDKHMGLLSVWRSGEGTEFTPRELEFLTSLGRQAAVAIENARLYRETQRRLKELEIINRVSTSLRMTQSIEEMLPILLNEALQLVGTPHGSIWLYDHTADRLRQRVAFGLEANVEHKSLSPMDGILGYTFRTGKTYFSTELKNDPLLFEGNRPAMTPGLGAICIPIQSTAGPVGVVAVIVKAEHQVSQEINLLTILAEITGNAIHRAQLYDQSQRQVRRLTSLRDIDSAIASSMDLRLTLNILMDQTLSHLNVDAVNIGLYHPDLQSLSYVASVGFTTPSPTRPQVRLGVGLAGRVLAKQQTYHISNLQQAPEATNEVLIKREGFVTYIGIPLIVKGQVKGIFEILHRTPLSPTPDWMEFLHTLAGQAAIAIDSSQLFENLQRSNQRLLQAYDTTLEGWARALELRDRETEGHTRRVTQLTMRLAKYIGVGENELVNLYRGVLLHDIGKMGVPDHILKKTGTLTEEEWAEMRMHPVYAHNLLSPISFLRGALDIPYCHHEWWNGKGYPRGLRGEQIPLAARIFSVVDNWDALLSDRPYRKAWQRQAVIHYIRQNAGTMFDPKVVNTFLAMIEQEGETN